MLNNDLMKNKILIITDYFYPSENGGGAQLAVTNLAKHLSKDHEVKVICRAHDFNNKLFFDIGLTQKYQNIEIIYFLKIRFLKIILLIRKLKPTQIYFNSFFSPLTILFLFVMIGEKSRIIIAPNGEFYDGALRYKKIKKSIWYLFFKTVFAKKFNTFHATSIDEKEIILKKLPSVNVLIARCIPFFDFKIRRKNFLSSSTKKIIFISRISQKKNLEYVIDILTQLKSKVIFEFWGAVDDEKYFQKCITKLNSCPSNIIWTYKGSFPIGKSFEKFGEADLFIFPTLGENFGFVILESLLSGCPVILSSGTTPWENLDITGVGYNIPLSNKSEWIQKVESFLSLPVSELERMRNNCIDFAIENLELKPIIEENFIIFFGEK